jgi:hypothetical protein
MDDEIKTVEEWAKAKGMLPGVFPGEDRRPTGSITGDARGSIAVPLGKFRGPRSNPEHWKFAAAKASGQWPEGKEVTEEEFDRHVRIATIEHQAR